MAQVLSHRGSGAEIYTGVVDAVVAGDEPPGREAMAPIWARWDAMSADEQAVAWRTSVDRFLATLDAVPDEVLSGATFTGPMGPMPLAMLPTMRVGEQVLHQWDVEVTFEPEAELLDQGAAVLAEQIPMIAGRMADAEAAKALGPLTLGVRTSDPAAAYTLTFGEEGVAVAEGEPAAADATVSLPMAAFVRLAWGRLDPAHTPAAVEVDGRVSLNDLRRVWPGR